uniref:Putative secreted protein n=1 Tax=Anopheles darlingi TaxID=43151 RepID=A0A2M4DFV5_ANODA
MMGKFPPPPPLPAPPMASPVLLLLAAAEEDAPLDSRTFVVSECSISPVTIDRSVRSGSSSRLLSCCRNSLITSGIARSGNSLMTASQNSVIAVSVDKVSFACTCEGLLERIRPTTSPSRPGAGVAGLASSFSQVKKPQRAHTRSHSHGVDSTPRTSHFGVALQEFDVSPPVLAPQTLSTGW